MIYADERRFKSFYVILIGVHLRPRHFSISLLRESDIVPGIFDCDMGSGTSL